MTNNDSRTTKILVFGRSGQVGWELCRSLVPLGNVIALDTPEVDFRHPDTLRSLLIRESPDLIVNAAAYTAVDKAESEPDLAMTVNCTAVGALAEEARKLGALLVHYSTDYIFDGAKIGPYIENDEPNPLSVYGRTKLAGERAIQAADCRHLVFRTSWVYAARGGNFAKTILRLASERDELKVVADQVGAPASAELIADVTALCISAIRRCPERFADAGGIYHLVPSGETSWHAYAKFVVETARQLGWPLKLASGAIHPIATSEYPLPAKRPASSRLDTSKLRTAFGIELPRWQTQVARLLEELCVRR